VGKLSSGHYDRFIPHPIFSFYRRVVVPSGRNQAARNYWKVLKNRLKKEGSQSVTNCHQLKMEAADGKKYLTDVADPARSKSFGY
jgi:hypothetical protein